MQKFTIPSLEALLDPAPVPQVSLDVSWEEYRHTPFLQIHSSGSTGIPKLSKYLSTDGLTELYWALALTAILSNVETW